ncbi:MAG: DUF86 domain-containing protein [Planctomycetaceae bacterium]
MNSERTDAAWLWDMLDAARTVLQFVDGKSLQDYECDVMLHSAVERQIEIIGEAARHVTSEFQDAHPEIQWRPITAQRHVLAHDYGEIKHDLIWRVATVHTSRRGCRGRLIGGTNPARFPQNHYAQES